MPKSEKSNRKSTRDRLRNRIRKSTRITRKGGSDSGAKVVLLVLHSPTCPYCTEFLHDLDTSLEKDLKLQTPELARIERIDITAPANADRIQKLPSFDTVPALFLTSTDAASSSRVVPYSGGSNRSLGRLSRAIQRYTGLRG